MAKVVVAVQDFLTRTTTGTLNVTTPELRGLKPKAALIICSGHDAGNDPAGTSHAMVSIGATDGTNQAMTCSTSEDAVADTDNYRDQGAASLLKIISIAGATLIEASFSAWLLDGITLNFTTANTTARRGFVVFFAGDDVSAYCGTKGLGTGTTALTVSGVGFQPDAVFAFSANNDNASAIGAAFGATFGIAVNDGSSTQKYISWAENDAIAAGGNPGQIIRSNRGLGQQAFNAATETYNLTFGNWSADGFDITPSASAGSDDMNFLALKFNGASFKLWDFSTPTSTGNVSDTTPGFKPQMVLAVSSNLESRDTSVYNGVLAGGMGIAASTASEQWAAAWRINDADPTDTGQITHANALNAPNGTAITTGVVASLVSMDATGWTLNYTDIEANAKMAFAFAVGPGDAVSIAPVANYQLRQQGIA